MAPAKRKALPFARMVALAGLAFLMVMEGFNQSPSFWLTLKLLGYEPKYIEHLAVLTVDGREMRIHEVLKCVPYNVAEIGNLTQKRYVQPQKAVTARLDDGSGLVIVLPNMCYKKVGTVSDTLRPVLGWMDSAQAPSMLQLFILPNSAAQSRHHIRLLSFRSSVSERNVPVDHSDRFGDWRVRSRDLTSYDNRFPENAVAVFGWSVSRAELAKETGQSLPLSDAQVLAIAVKDRAGMSLDRIVPNRFDRIYRTLQGEPSSPVLSSMTDALEQERRLIPFRFANGEFAASPEDRGTVIYYLEPLALGGGRTITAPDLAYQINQRHEGSGAGARVTVKPYIEDEDIVYAVRFSLGSFTKE
jgi:hypothetical protein